MKNLLKLNGAQKLSKNELTEINGGKAACDTNCYILGANCHSLWDCSSPGVCQNVPGSGLKCTPY